MTSGGIITVRRSIIHVNNHRLRKGLPPISVRNSRSGKARYCSRVFIAGPSSVVHDPERPLPCGAKVWVETFAEVTEYVAVEDESDAVIPTSPRP